MHTQAKTTQIPNKTKVPRERLVTIKLEEDQIREMARQMALSGRAAEAQQMNEVLTQTDSALVKMPVEEAIRLAIAVHRARNFTRAEAHYRAVLKAEPKHPRANHFLGVLLHQMQRSKEGLLHVRRSLQALGDEGWAWNNLGNILVHGGQVAEAEDAYLKALALQPDMIDAHNNYSVICRQQERLEEACKHADRALELNPDFAEAHINRGKIHMEMKQPDQAMACFSRALLLQPLEESGRSRRMLGFAYATLGKLDEAAAVYRDWLKEEPDNAVAAHMLKACLGAETPDRAEDSYVAQTFDQFANSFDSKLAHLGYRAPGLVVDAVAALYPKNGSFGVVADAGCGTGLCAPLLRDRTRKLIGVDLSGGMLSKARERGGYDELHEAELTAFLLDRHGTFDTIICADTLCYFGLIDGFLNAAHGAMKPDGVLVFTVESSPEEETAPYKLHLHGRFAHRRDYVERALAEGRFSLREIRAEALRKEGGRPVMGYLVSAVRT